MPFLDDAITVVPVGLNLVSNPRSRGYHPWLLAVAPLGLLNWYHYSPPTDFAIPYLGRVASLPVDCIALRHAHTPRSFSKVRSKNSFHPCPRCSEDKDLCPNHLCPTCLLPTPIATPGFKPWTRRFLGSGRG